MPLPPEIGFVNPDGSLQAPANINVIVGRNGSGKSLFLRWIFGAARDASNATYLSPERTGLFQRAPDLEQTSLNVPRYIADQRLQNQAAQFKQGAELHLRQLELIFLRQMETKLDLRRAVERTFKSEYLDKINRMLTNVAIVQEGSLLSFRNLDGEVVLPGALSSGESELFGLGAEVLFFFANLDKERMNILLIDEPDVHLHPDLQERFASLLLSNIEELEEELRARTIVVLATHSTAFICALSASPLTRVGTKEFGSNSVRMQSVAPSIAKTLAFFGHPLSLAISSDPLVIVEGEDDERVWSQAARGSNGRLRLFPCLSTTISQQAELENFSANMLAALYAGSAVGFSIRDGDGAIGALAAVGCIQRFRLQCYEIENALLTDECLALCGTDWEQFVVTARRWLESNPSHQASDALKAALDSGNRGRHIKIKAARTMIVDLIDARKRPWEVLVGRAIGNLTGVLPSEVPQHSIVSYLGPPLLVALGLLRPVQ